MGKIVTFKGQAATDFIRAYREAHYGEQAALEPRKPSIYAMAREYILQTYPTVPRDLRKGMKVYSPYYKKHGRITHFKDAYVIVKLQDVGGACQFHPLDLEYQD